MLAENGYRCAMSGKWHLTYEKYCGPGGPKHSWPRQRGFDRFFSCGTNGKHTMTLQKTSRAATIFQCIYNHLPNLFPTNEGKTTTRNIPTKLIAHSGGDFRVSLRRQGWFRPRFSEPRLLAQPRETSTTGLQAVRARSPPPAAWTGAQCLTRSTRGRIRRYGQ